MKNICIMMISAAAMILLIPLAITKGAWMKNAPAKINTSDEPLKTSFRASPASREGSILAEDVIDEGQIIKVFNVESNKIMEMKLEEYIRGVLAGEMPAEFEIEALKAQAVAARTYAVVRMGVFGGKGCSNHPGADICTDSTHCQEWISKEERIKSWSPIEASQKWQKITQAVNDTKDMILVYDAAPVMYPMYFSTSSGKTENSKDIFSSQMPYLRSVVSPNEETAPKFTSRVSFTKDEFVKKFSESQYNIKLDKNKLPSQIQILERTEGGSVRTIKVGGKSLTGMDVRKLLGLNSANFTIEFGNKDVIFNVIGYGHGVGMSQWGANAMAKEGKKFDEILKHYYQGVEIDSIKNVYGSK